MPTLLDVPDPIVKRRDAWYRIAMRLSTTRYAVGILGVASAALSAAVGGEVGPYLAALAATCTAVLGFSRPETRYPRFFAAWRKLDICIIKYQLGKATLDDLIKAIEDGENIVAEPLIGSNELKPKDNNDEPPA